MRGKPLHSLARGLIRMSWNKYNLYNLASRTFTPNLANRTLYQQKWTSKCDTRSYHGPQLTEREFLRVFDPRLPTSNTRLGTDRGQGRHPPASTLTFAELERRLDFIVFRSNFAPSIHAARQLCVHGKVTLNGKKMAYPSHRVKDGDIISVDPSSVSVLSGKKGTELTFAPKPFSQPFLFVPDYLEVNYNICSTVFLRAPMSKPGRTELPSPFPPEMHSLVYEFYAKRK
ncbi:hypothetical protein BC937DRAFT_89721 [Endogone sp. FLAS-F59071]|nr:hypothetical protein BC937DRAFT_89721 [Endogone sp. FLAS-F59071]|eukprot:RUS23251.1 hypothetical protein BC937DRAFT_89721 [Endogone sp. FLAS-F59071]